MNICLKVNYHPSGRLTLSKCEDGKFSSYKDYSRESGLNMNDDAASFYQKLAHEIVDLTKKGASIELLDDAGDVSGLQKPRFGFLSDSAL